jgi:exodeoxyribonuclease VII large subunit
LAPRIWQVGALCRAVADALDAGSIRWRFAAKSRALTCRQRALLFSIKDDTGQIRCAMFRRAAGLLDFVPRDGELVEVRGRLGVL